MTDIVIAAQLTLRTEQLGKADSEVKAHPRILQNKKQLGGKGLWSCCGSLDIVQQEASSLHHEGNI